jgi:hypothetical protein
MLLKIAYLLVRQVLGLAILMFRGDGAKEAELLVLRHENADDQVRALVAADAGEVRPARYRGAAAWRQQTDRTCRGRD